MDPKLEFYEVVCLLSVEPVPKRLWNTFGVIVGRADGGLAGWEYAVQAFADQNACWQFPECCLRSEGRRMRREELYDGSSSVVVVDLKTGLGTRKE